MVSVHQEEGGPCSRDALAMISGEASGVYVSNGANESGYPTFKCMMTSCVAGAVLGATGGVVTNSLMKKNQIENGFEDLRCFVGDKNMGEWNTSIVLRFR